MNNYVTVDDGTNGVRRLRVVFAGYDSGLLTPQEVTRSLTSRASKQYAPGYRYWQFISRVKGTEDANYATIAMIEGWETKNSLAFVDPVGTSFTVLMTGGGDIKRQQIVPVFDSAESFFYVPLRFEEIL